ncbi:MULTISPECIES: THUMP-like domain-containing protein [unclassified Schaalia]|uniref:THUMP-like domain-containing protein n=1 Tax=unclassified Schaalia TaxID=2691889 RepID=UPI001E4B2F38|nr:MULTISPECIES: SAM-dependent methyltransferase [unclassified Schaalia]MCD4549811.1 SAM-dependent methyltransferase [Schaalia sp. lx-260]MCD4556827.1 SAM-dependent methyltransferase [Schaalia sp. lx-100]
MDTSLRLILDSPAWEILQAWEKRPERRTLDSLSLSTALRSQGVTPHVASAILQQLDLREAAERKFGSLARHMVFTREGLEQASRLSVATTHAQRFHRAGVTYLADLGCGIGTESLTAAGLGIRTFSLDIDEDSAAAAAANLRDFPESEVLCGDVLQLEMSDLIARGVNAIFADPARRSGLHKGNTRIQDPEHWAPPLSTVLSWTQYIPALGVKVAPGIAYEVLPADFHVQWTSVDGQLVEAALWSPPLAIEGPGRSAQIIREQTIHIVTDPHAHTPCDPITPAPVGPLSRFIMEPDDAIIRSGTISAIADQYNLHLIDSRIAYLTGDTYTPSPFYSAFEVHDVTALRPKQISAALRHLDAGYVEIKKRGADISPEVLRRQLKLTGSTPAVVIATRIQGQHRAIIGRRVC